MKLKIAATILILVTGCHAYANCKVRDAVGFWHMTTNESGFVSYCTMLIRSDGTLNTAKSSCEAIGVFGEKFSFLFNSGNVKVKSTCEITINLENEFGGSTTISHGQMSRNGEQMIGMGDNEGNPLTFNGVKFN